MTTLARKFDLSATVAESPDPVVALAAERDALEDQCIALSKAADLIEDSLPESYRGYPAIEMKYSTGPRRLEIETEEVLLDFLRENTPVFLVGETRQQWIEGKTTEWRADHARLKAVQDPAGYTAARETALEVGRKLQAVVAAIALTPATSAEGVLVQLARLEHHIGPSKGRELLTVIMDALAGRSSRSARRPSLQAT